MCGLQHVQISIGVLISVIISTFVSAPASSEANSLWAHDNLVAWEVIPFDSLKRGPEDRAKMFKRLGIRHYAYLNYPDLEPKDPGQFRLQVDAEIEAMQRYGIDIIAWYFWIESDDAAEDPKVTVTLESFKRHGVHPQLWVAQSERYLPKTSEQWAKYYPPGIEPPPSYANLDALSDTDVLALANANRENFPKNMEEYKQRVQREATRIATFVRLATPYGCHVDIYNHGGWFGVIDNQLAVLDRLKTMGVNDVGMVYNFSHARDPLHDDSKDFAELWKRIRAHVVEVNVTAMKIDTGDVYYPSQGEGELEMMRIIQKSNWKGPIGIVVQRHEDAEVVLKNDGEGLDWLAAELRRAGSGGPRPFPIETHELR
jgi:hypothetical protein